MDIGFRLWEKERPNSPGLYWCKDTSADIIWPVMVYKENDKDNELSIKSFTASNSGYPISSVKNTIMWTGPIAPPLHNVIVMVDGVYRVIAHAQ